MKKTLVLALFLVVALAGFGYAAKKMVILNFNKGELPADNWGCSCALSEEHADTEGDYTMKIDYTDKDGFCGQMKPKKGSWKGFKKFKFVIFNPSDKPLKDFGLCLKGAKNSNGPENRRDWKMDIPAGKSEQEVVFDGALCNDGKSTMDMSTVFIWNWDNYAEQKFSVFIVKCWVEE